MEVGAVKQAFNNEVLHLKKKLNQAKIQIIHKLTRKAKMLAQKKNGPEQLLEKLKKKVETAVKEVLLIKKITVKDLAKFTITHKGELKDFLNKPHPDHDKVCAKLLLHKALHDKYKFLRERFTDVHIDDLLMSREERRKIKKEAKEKQKKKGSKQNASTGGDWSVENVDKDKVASVKTHCTVEANDDVDSDDKECSENEHERDSNDEGNQDYDKNDEEMDSGEDEEVDDEIEEENCTEVITVDRKGSKLLEQIINSDTEKKPLPAKCENKLTQKDNKKVKRNKETIKINNNKFKDKLLTKKFNREIELEQPKQEKVVDPFFITSTGESYMSLVEPRPPDEVKEVHRQGNRKLRRAVMFGHVPKFRSKPDYNNKFDRQNDFQKGNNKSQGNREESFKNGKHNFRRKNEFNDPNKREEPEKLHPSWEAKKRQSGILPFQGKKIVFE